MPKIDHIRPGGVMSKGTVLHPKSDMSLLDQRASELINADDGGDFVPQSQIVFGSGLAASINSRFSFRVAPSSYVQATIRGGVTTRRGCIGISLHPTGHPYFRDPGDTVDVSRNQTVTMPIYAASAASGQNLFSWDPVLYEMHTLALLNAFHIPLGPRRIFYNATLASITLKWRCVVPRTALPTNQPNIEAFKHAADGTRLSLTSTGALAIGATSVNAYYNNGRPQDIVYTPDQNNTLLPVDRGYHLVWTEEDGVMPNALISVKLSFTANTRQWEI